MFINENLYTLRTVTAEGFTRYYVSFTDGQAIRRETEVSRAVYLEFLRFVQIERSLRHWDERHREYTELTDETLHSRAVNKPKSLEESFFDGLRDEQLWFAIEELTEIQRRRFILHYEFGLTYGQIAVVEGCSRQSATRSITRAKETIRQQLKFF